MAAAISLFQTLRPSTIFLKPPCLPPFPSTFCTKQSGTRFRRLCSTFAASAEGASDKSILGDFLDYLNESWTQFHATGIPSQMVFM